MAMVAAIGLGLKIASGVVSGIQEQQAAEYNAERSMQNAALVRIQSKEEARVQSVYSRKTLGRIKANIGSSGLSFSGSARDIYEASAHEAELDHQKILTAGENKARGLEGDAGLYRSQAAAAPWAGGVSAGATLLGDGAKWYEKYA